MMTDCDADRDEFDGTVELRPASVWTCPGCGLENHMAAVTLGPLDVVCVVCGHCGGTYAATGRRGDEDDDTGEGPKR